MLPSKPANVVVPATPAVQVATVTEKYDLIDNEEKGKGAFSRVVVGHTKPAGEPRAIKIMERSILTGKKADMVAHEREILRRTKHDNIIYLHECLITADKVYMVMDLMQGDLFDYIVKRKRLSERDSCIIMHQLLSAVDFLHTISVIHRDIKPENILISDDGNGNLRVKLADFGLAKVLESWTINSTPCGTSFYIAPEIIRGIEANGARPLCTNREEVKFVDIWSCGVVLFVMLAGRPPFYGQVKTRDERRALLAKIDRGLLFPDAQWAGISDEAKDLCSKLLCHDPALRIGAKEALKHPFFAKYDVTQGAAAAAASAAAPGADDEAVTDLAAQLNAMTVDQRADLGDDDEHTSYKQAQVRNELAAGHGGAKVKMSTAGIPARGK